MLLPLRIKGAVDRVRGDRWPPLIINRVRGKRKGGLRIDHSRVRGWRNRSSVYRYSRVRDPCLFYLRQDGGRPLITNYSIDHQLMIERRLGDRDPRPPTGGRGRRPRVLVEDR